MGPGGERWWGPRVRCVCIAPPSASTIDDDMGGNGSRCARAAAG
eukprot:COSAG01_NODE_66033_length_271_cov_0.906977_1_plen_43_part_10